MTVKVEDDHAAGHTENGGVGMCRAVIQVVCVQTLEVASVPVDSAEVMELSAMSTTESMACTYKQREPMLS
jgi:hypothetical protein